VNTFNDACDNVTDFYALEKAIDDAKIFLADTKAEAAEAKANDAAAQTAALKYTPEKTKITGVKKAKKKATISFKKVKKNVTGYELRIKNKKNGKVKIVKVKQGKKNTVKKTVKGLKKNTKYSVKVRAYKKANGKTYYAKWSKAKSFKTLKK
jgi:hypothetical protein